ncbi:MAG: hypothetical protein P1V51_18635 [Deltaproteobacteria bacterium]|nr:hypothetical protein [Deltaproteobacteria bacterium]
MALRRLDEWVETRWVRDAEEAREALDNEPEIDLVLLSSGADGRAIHEDLSRMIRSWKHAPTVAVVCDELTPLLRATLAMHPVTALEHPLKAGDLGALLREAALARGPLVEHRMHF